MASIANTQQYLEKERYIFLAGFTLKVELLENPGIFFQGPGKPPEEFL